MFSIAGPFRTEANSYNWVEWTHTEGQFGPMECLIKTTRKIAPGQDDNEFAKQLVRDNIDNPEVFPVKMSDELAKRCPPTVLTTCEFDDYRRDSEMCKSVAHRFRSVLSCDASGVAYAAVLWLQTLTS